MLYLQTELIILPIATLHLHSPQRQQGGEGIWIPVAVTKEVRINYVFSQIEQVQHVRHELELQYLTGQPAAMTTGT